MTPEDRELLRDAIVEELKNLGEDTAQIAAALHEDGCWGQALDCEECPIAVRVLGMIPPALGLVVQADSFSIRIYVEKADGTPGDKVLLIRTPGAISCFMGRFDLGHFPEIEL